MWEAAVLGFDKGAEHVHAQSGNVVIAFLSFLARLMHDLEERLHDV